MIEQLSRFFFHLCGVAPVPYDPGQVPTMLDAMEHSALGVCVAQSAAGYYIMLAFHAVGLAMIVGIMMVVDLRILGVVRGIAPKGLPGLVSLAWWGFWINAVSGVALLFSEAVKMYPDVTFRWKLFLVLVGVVTTMIFNNTVLKPAAAGDADRLRSTGARAQAILSLVIWLAVITTGRMIAYIGK